MNGVIHQGQESRDNFNTSKPKALLVKAVERGSEKSKHLNIYRLYYCLYCIIEVIMMSKKNKLIRGMDDELWNKFSSSARSMGMNVSELLKHILNEYFEEKEMIDQNLIKENKILSLASMCDENRRTNMLADRLTARLVLNLLEDWEKLSIKYEGGQVKIKLSEGWKDLPDYGIKNAFEKLNKKESLAFISLLLYETSRIFSIFGIENLSKFKNI